MKMTGPLRIVFLGADPIALPLLDWLASGGKGIGQIVAVFTQPDRPVGRGQKLTANPIKLWAGARGLPVFQPEKLTAEDCARVKNLGADLSLVMAYGHLLRDEFIAAPRLGTLNLHTSILPRYRGASPIQTAVACGERETGVTLMRIVLELDAGPVADVERVPIGAHDTAADIDARLSAACVPLLARSLPKLANGSLVFTEQDHAAATFCRRLAKEDGVLDFRASARELAARINGLFPWPSCSVEMSGQVIKMGLAEAEGKEEEGKKGTGEGEGAALAPGTVLDSDGKSIRVATGGGVLRLLKLQRPGGRMLAAPEFLRGFSIAAGAVLPSKPMPPLVADAPFPRK